MRRSDREVTDPMEIEAILSRAKVCHVAFETDGAPYLLPLNYGYEMQNGTLKLYFHGAFEGRKAELIQKRPRTGFAIDVENGLIEAKTACGYGYRYESIVGSGVCEALEDVREKKRALCAIMRQQAGREFSFTDEQVSSCAVFCLTCDEFSAKRHE